MRYGILFTAALGAALLAPAGAQAGTISFSGGATGRGFAGPDDSCAPLPFHGVLPPSTSSGHSNLGAFTYGHEICLSGLSGPSGGTFTVDFGYASFTGNMVGGSMPSDTPGVGNVSWTYTILGGTGKFLGATGSFTGIGTSDARTRPSFITLTFDGNVSGPGVPEPSSWALLALGFGLGGAALRYKREAVGLAIKIA